MACTARHGSRSSGANSLASKRCSAIRVKFTRSNRIVSMPRNSRTPTEWITTRTCSMKQPANSKSSTRLMPELDNLTSCQPVWLNRCGETPQPQETSLVAFAIRLFSMTPWRSDCVAAVPVVERFAWQSLRGPLKNCDSDT